MESTVKYKWLGSGAIRTPSGVVERGGIFEADEQWLAQHPHRRWRSDGLIVPAESKPRGKK
jgi:hypothetical protein